MVYCDPETTVVIMTNLTYSNSSEAHFTGVKVKISLHNSCRNLIKSFFINCNDKNVFPVLY